MLSEMIFAIECSLRQRPACTSGVAVTSNVLGTWINSLTEGTSDLVIVWIDINAAIWSADPLLERQVHRLLVALPIVLCPEAVCAECTLKLPQNFITVKYFGT